MHRALQAGVVSTVIVLLTTTAHGAPTAQQRCQAAKNMAAEKYAKCRQNAENVLASTVDAVRYDAVITRCEEKFAVAWQKAIDTATAASATCLDAPLTAADCKPVIGEHCDNIATPLGGGRLPDCTADLSTRTTDVGACTTNLGTCNAGTAVAGDADLAAENISNGVDIFDVTGTALPASRLRTRRTPCEQAARTLGASTGSRDGQDGSTLKGPPRSYTANADGTITDHKTGLIWEKLDDNDANGIHDYSASFTWYNAFKKIQVLNGDVAGCMAASNPDTCCTGAGIGSCSPFAGQTDWRLPNVNDLQSLADYGRSDPAIAPVFNTSCGTACTAGNCSCTQSSTYWSSTTAQISPTVACVYFLYGNVSSDLKSSAYYVRAVRGGS